VVIYCKDFGAVRVRKQVAPQSSHDHACPKDDVQKTVS